MPARLVPLTAIGAPVITVQRPILLIGRHPECDVRLDLPQVSRRHCCLAQVYDRLVLRDLGSRNGVRVNGRMVEEADLRPGDEIAIAQVLYRLEEVPAAAMPQPAKPGAMPTAPPRPAPPPAVPKPAAPEPGSLPELPVDLGEADAELIPLDE